MVQYTIDELVDKKFTASDGNYYAFFDEKMHISGGKYNTIITIHSEEHIAQSTIKTIEAEDYLMFDKHKYKIKFWEKDGSGKLLIKAERSNGTPITFEQV